MSRDLALDNFAEFQKNKAVFAVESCFRDLHLPSTHTVLGLSATLFTSMIIPRPGNAHHDLSNTGKLGTRVDYF